MKIMRIFKAGMLLLISGPAFGDGHLPRSVLLDPAMLEGIETCPARMPGDAAELICSCSETGPSRSVWGIGPYTADSDICTAARHAGIVADGGGPVVIVEMDGQDAYEGSEANGVTTRSWGSYGRSILLVAVEVKSDAALCSIMPSGVDRHSCDCPANANPGAIWGNGPYTADSDICTAALHDGTIDIDGGPVTVLRIGGLEAYSGVDINGIVSRDWGSYSSSIVFDRN